MFKTLELPGGFAPLAPLPGLCPAPTGGLKRPLDPSPNNFAPPISNSWLRPCVTEYPSKHKDRIPEKCVHVCSRLNFSSCDTYGYTW